MVHLRSNHHRKRQGFAEAPTGIAGVSGVQTVQTKVASTVTGLSFDSSVTDLGQTTAPPLVQVASTSTSSPVTTDEPPPLDPQSNASRPISMTTVIASCVGAFVGALVVILVGYLWYRRYSNSLKSRARTVPERKRRMSSDGPRSRSRQDWNKLADNQDSWEGPFQTKEMDNIGSMEKLTMFKKSTPSVKTSYTQADIPIAPEAYPPSLQTAFQQQQQQRSASMSHDDPAPRNFLGRVDAGLPLSWTSDVGGGESSFLSVRSSRLSGAMSPTLNMAIPTPAATSNFAPRWESAEVISIADRQSVATNPFDSDSEYRQSYNNPFSNAQEPTAQRRRSQSLSSSYSHKKLDKGKSRAVDPFESDNEPPPPVVELQTVNNSHAIQSLIAALDIPPETRIRSMQPSIVSANSAYTEVEGDVTEKFPFPPSSATSHNTTFYTT